MASLHSDIDAMQRDFDFAGDDFGKLMILVGKYGIPTGKETPDSVHKAKTLISNYIECERRSTTDKHEALDLRCSSLRKKLQEYRKIQDSCGELFFDRTAREVPNLSIFMTSQLYRICQDFKDQLNIRSQNLKAGRLQILVTGEICAGKSSVLSLLMGGAYLPVDHGPCTRIPCEVIHSERRRAFLYFKNEYGIDPAEVELHYDDNHESWKRIKECIVVGKDSMSEKILEKVVLYWPLVILASQESRVLYKRTEDNVAPTATEPEGIQPISFVDVPGIFDNDNSFINLYPYIRSSDAFLIVVNNADQIGLAKDRVVRLMEIIQNFSEECQGTFHPKVCLFVCNKWDRIPVNRRDSLHTEITSGLKKIWPGVTGRQVVPCVASAEALSAVKSRSIGEEYETFSHKMCWFLETAIRAQIEVNSWWLASFLDRATVILRNVNEVKAYAKIQKEDVKRQITRFVTTLNEFDTKRNKVEQLISTHTNTIQEKVRNAISDSLDKNKTRLSTWDACAMPRLREGGGWTQLHNEIVTAIAERIEMHINEDQTIQKIKDEFDATIGHQLFDLLRSCDDLGKHMPLIVDITNGMETKFEGINTALRQRRDILPYVAAGLAVAFFPLAPLVLVLWRIFDEISNPKILYNEKDFTNDSYGYMEKQTKCFIENVTKNKLMTVTEAAVQDVPRNAKFTLAFLHNRGLELRRAADDLKSYIGSEDHQGESSYELEQISEQLKNFVIEKVLINDIDDNSLEVDLANPLTEIGRGAYSRVHRGSLITDTETLRVAVKQIRWPRGDGEFPDNTFIIRELLILQMLSQKPKRERRHFIEYHGFRKTSGTYDFQLLLVTDLYEYNLKSLIETEKLVLPSNPGALRTKRFPAEEQQETSWAYVLHIIRQAAKGVQFLHRYNIVHRDLKPSNFLLRFTPSDIHIYLADLGMSQQISLIQTRGPFVGTDLYNAPEVRSQGVHSTASDIYSLCLIFYELWYGRTVYAELSVQQLREKNRKPPTLTRIVPPATLNERIKNGWHSNPAMRPNINAIVACVDELCDKYKWPRNDN